MSWKLLVALITIGLGILFAVTFRYEIIGVSAGGEGNHGVAYRLDRWTGEVTWMSAKIGGRVDLKAYENKE